MTPDRRLDQLEPLMADVLQKVDRLIEGQGQIVELVVNTKAELDDTKIILQGVKRTGEATAAELQTVRKTGEATAAELQTVRKTGEATAAELQTVRKTGEATAAELQTVRKTGEATAAELQTVRKTGEATAAELQTVRKTGEATAAELQTVRRTGEITAVAVAKLTVKVNKLDENMSRMADEQLEFRREVRQDLANLQTRQDLILQILRDKLS